MEHYAGLDVLVKETSICIVDEAGRICREMKIPFCAQLRAHRPSALRPRCLAGGISASICADSSLVRSLG